MNTPPIVDQGTWRIQLDELRLREKAATRALDVIAASPDIAKAYGTT